MKTELKFLNENIKNGSTVIVACSGGPDSMCLIDLVTQIKEEKNIKIICAHVNHKVRLESDNEALMVERYCKKNKIIFELLEINEYKVKKFNEEDARRRRYKYFEMLIKKYNAKYLLTAHHGDDLIETILMRIVRGSNLSGYVGIKKINENKEYTILRPFLTTTKENIICYNKNTKIEYAIDKSNESLKHTRNRFRKRMLPFLKEENKDVHLKFLKFSEELNSYQQFVEEYIKEKKIIDDDQIVINNILNESDFIKRKSIELIIKEIQKREFFEISDNQVKEILKIINKSNKSIDLKNGFKCINEYGLIKILKEESKAIDTQILNNNLSVDNFNFYFLNESSSNDNWTIRLSTKEIKFPLYIRGRENNDKLIVKNLNGSKKVNEIFNENKIPKNKRDSYPVIIDSDNNIIWIPGLKKSKFCKDKTEKYDIIIRCEAR